MLLKVLGIKVKILPRDIDGRGLGITQLLCSLDYRSTRKYCANLLHIILSNFTGLLIYSLYFSIIYTSKITFTLTMHFVSSFIKRYKDVLEF